MGPHPVPSPLRALSWFSVGAVFILGGIATTATIINEVNAAERRDELAAGQAAAAVTAQVATSVRSLQGADSMAVDGEVTEAEFDAYAHDVLNGAPFSSLAREEVVSAAERAAFEQRTGIHIRDDAAEDAPPAPERDHYLPVRQIVPFDGVNRQVLGFDISSEPTRAAATRRAAEVGRPVLSGPLRLAASAQPGFFLVRPLRDPTGPDAEPIGYVSTGFPAESLLDSARHVLPPFTAVSLRVDGVAIAGNQVERGVVHDLEGEAAGWSLQVDDPDDVRPAVPLAVAIGTALLAVALFFILRHQRLAIVFREALASQEREDLRRSEALAMLARRLSFAETVDDVVAVITEEGARVMGASFADLGMLHEPTILSMGLTSAAVDPAAVAPFREVSIEDHHPTGEAVRTRATVVVTDLREYQAGHPEVLAAVVASGYRSAAAAPLFDLEGEPIGVVAFVWGEVHPLDDAELSALETVARICGQALRRTRLAQRTEALTGLTAALAAAATEAEVADEVARSMPGCVGSCHANIRIYDERTRTLETFRDGVLDAELEARFKHLSIDEDLPISAAFRDAEPVFIGNFALEADRFPDAVAPSRAAGFEASASQPLCGSGGSPIGVLALAWARPVRFTRELRESIAAIGEIVAQTIERVMLALHGERLAQQRQLVAELGQRLAEASSTDEVVATLEAQAPAVPGAGRVTVTVIESLPWEPDLPIVHDEAVERDGAVERGTAVERTRPATLVEFPLTGSGRRSLGEIGFAWDLPREVDRPLTELLAQVVDAAAGALDRVIVSARHRRQAAELNVLAANLATASDQANIAREVAERCPLLVGCTSAVVALYDERTQALISIVVDGDGSGARSRIVSGGAASAGDGSGSTGTDLHAIPLDAEGPVAEAFRTEAPVTVVGPAAGDVATKGGPTGIRNSISLPLRHADSRVVGVLTIGWPYVVELNEELMTLLTTVVELTGLTLERADLYEREHRIVSTMQQRLLSPLPVVDGLDLASVYEPATTDVGIGGDWYEGFVVPEGVVLVVGDVVGHGVDAVVSMAQTQYIVAGLMQAQTPLRELFPRANEMLSRDATMFSTAQLLHIDRHLDRLGYLNAGHPYALLRLPDGEVRQLSSGKQPLLGLPIASIDPTYEPFPVGAMVLSYTDGLIERRDEVITESITHLGTILAGVDPSRTADAILGEILRTCVATHGKVGVNDDIAAVLAIRRS